MKEWWDAGWVQPFEDGKNIYNTAWLAVAKVSGGRVAPDDTRVCMDYHPGNGKSKDPEYFIPRVKDLLTKVWGMEVFTELDLANAYHQIKLHPDSRKYSGFYFPGEGQFIWNVLFFGVKGAVTHFQRVMEEALSDVPSHIVVVIYVDNIWCGLWGGGGFGGSLGEVVDGGLGLVGEGGEEGEGSCSKVGRGESG